MTVTKTIVDVSVPAHQEGSCGYRLPLLLSFALLCGTLLCDLARAEPPRSTAADPAPSHASAAKRSGRVVFNNDGSETALRMTEPTAEALVSVRTTPVVGTGVSTVSYCTRSSGFGLFTHETKIGDVFTTREGRYRNNQTAALIEAGLDPLRVVVDYCHANDLECWWSMRMNDTHDAQRGSEPEVLLGMNTLKTQHPEYLLGSPGKKPKIGAWTAVDYLRPEIRDLAYRYVEEVCQNYDVDGIELDLTRHPVFFPSNAAGKPATAEELAAMTDMMQRIRAMTQREAARRGRPILVSVICPDSVGYCRTIGLAIDDWMEQQLLDIWMPGGKFQLENWDQAIMLGKRFQVEVVPNLHNSYGRDELAKQQRATVESYRGRAASAWGAGADGIYLYNFPTDFDPQVYEELGNREALATLDRDYFASPQGMFLSANGCFPLDDFQQAENLNPSHPKQLRTTKATTVRLYVGDKLAATPGMKVNLRVRLDARRDPAELECLWNQQPIEFTTADGNWLEAEVSPESVLQGENQLQVTPVKDASPGNLLDAVLQVRPRISP
ncbi:hypothetical protein [Aeoliella sp. SH292]|uniref:hypothetical protein n=1 Tax=Aeoliella sp. SH292 TaxID=3454464 RepID=UPI003F9A8919